MRRFDILSKPRPIPVGVADDCKPRVFVAYWTDSGDNWSNSSCSWKNSGGWSNSSGSGGK